MINILFVFSGQLSNGGTEKVMLNIYKYIDKSKFKIDFLILGENERESAEENWLRNNGAHIYYIIGRKKSYIKHLRELRCFMHNHRYDIVHTHMDAIGADTLRIAKKEGIKCRIAHSHNTNQLANPQNIIEILHKTFINVEKFELRYYATDYIACSYIAGEWLFGSKICKNDSHFMVLKNAIDIEKYIFRTEVRCEKRNELGIFDDKTKIIGHVGRLCYQKNQLFLLDIFKKILDNYKDTVLVLVGEGEDRQVIEQKIIANNLSHKVILLGNRDDVPELLMTFDLFLLPSRYEGLPIALLEAITAGLRCIVSDCISSEAKISESVSFLPIEDTAVWEKEALTALNSHKVRYDCIDNITKEGYSIKHNIKNLDRFYFNAVSK